MRPDDDKWVDRETGIWSLEVETVKKRHRFDACLCGAIAHMHRNNPPKVTVDLGCGPGYYCRALQYGFGWPKVIGVEGTPNITSLGVYSHIYEQDLSKKLPNNTVHVYVDLVLCLEVGEHIPRKHEQVFIDNVCMCTYKDLILSWGVPGQDGTGHFNLRDNDYVIGQFEKRGLEIDWKRSEWLRKHSSYEWFRNTLMFFRRKE